MIKLHVETDYCDEVMVETLLFDKLMLSPILPFYKFSNVAPQSMTGKTNHKNLIRQRKNSGMFFNENPRNAGAADKAGRLELKFNRCN